MFLFTSQIHKNDKKSKKMTKKFFSCNKKTKKVKKGRQKTFLSEKRQFCRFYDKKTKKVIFHQNTPGVN